MLRSFYTDGNNGSQNLLDVKSNEWTFVFVSKPEYSDDDEDSLFNAIKHGVHFPDDDNDLHNDSSLEILEYDASISEKVRYKNVIYRNMFSL